MRLVTTCIKPHTDKTWLLLFYLAFGYLVSAYAKNLKGETVCELVQYLQRDNEQFLF